MGSEAKNTLRATFLTVPHLKCVDPKYLFVENGLMDCARGDSIRFRKAGDQGNPLGQD